MKKLFWIGIFALVVSLLSYKIIEPNDHPEAYDIHWTEYTVQPDDITCGPTSVYMVLRQYGKRPEFEDVEKATKTKWFMHKGQPIGMTSPEYISVAMNHFGVPARKKYLTFDQLKYHISKDRPVIVLVRSGTMTWHYIVVTGYDTENVTAADPAWGGPRVLPVNDFIKSWNFISDLHGVPIITPCSWCGGSGKWFKADLGPLSVCSFCDGSGVMPDFLGGALRNADVYPMTAIVPIEGLPLSSVTKNDR
jgi:hypothetical protein